jgi:hypothetical protein
VLVLVVAAELIGREGLEPAHFDLSTDVFGRHRWGVAYADASGSGFENSVLTGLRRASAGGTARGATISAFCSASCCRRSATGLTPLRAFRIAVLAASRASTSFGISDRLPSVSMTCCLDPATV